VAGLFFFQNVEQHVGEAEHCGRIKPLGVDSRVFDEGIIGSENKSKCIQKK
jgi:hypothetical protein